MHRHAMLAVAAVAVLVAAGCLGVSGRSDWAYEVTQIDAAQAIGRTGAGVRVGVLDTGIDIHHPSLSHLTDGDTGNGELIAYRDFLAGRDGVQHADDTSGHGTHVIAIMTGKGSSFRDRLLYGGVDLGGGSPNIHLYVATVCGAQSCSASAIHQALDWMDQIQVDIVSMSLGGARTGPPLFTDDMVQRINRLIDRGTVVIAAAGNSGPCGERPSTDVDAPADIPGVIAVGAIDARLEVSCLSSRGNNTGLNACRTLPLGVTQGRCDPHKKPELVAPGVDILSAWSDGGYARATGTSQAAPFVASVVALMLEGQPDLRTRDDVVRVKQVLADTARPLPGHATTGHDPAAGYGLVQAMAAIQAY